LDTRLARLFGAPPGFFSPLWRIKVEAASFLFRCSGEWNTGYPSSNTVIGACPAKFPASCVSRLLEPLHSRPYLVRK